LVLFEKLNGQNTNNKQYKREVNKFILFIRSSEFKDTAILVSRNYLCNIHMFQGMPLYGKGKFGLSDEEKEELAKFSSIDTTKLYIDKKIIIKSKMAIDTVNQYWEFSKPIFMRSYLLCVFSFGEHFDPNFDAQKTFLYKKERGKWNKLFEIGAIKNY